MGSQKGKASSVPDLVPRKVHSRSEREKEEKSKTESSVYLLPVPPADNFVCIPIVLLMAMLVQMDGNFEKFQLLTPALDPQKDCSF